eukprot:TRINITY_DN37823_c3_g1_i1.p1 TRINITY_DN37823_c3_g1~~TRINITY_DN37823_c3_g1_i1.p1  ORF type:complete len:1944 (-),score=476.32 TRINITY_DN37823_c3_g1_i1:482-6313(-)
MPISRYQLRSEYSLADPELYRAADRDDPEALLEGVAMAGLVGVLRQLGDLAEFAAEIFHELHEEVMATASRGHGLVIRVQQLEAEIPSIEKALLSQTSHSHLTDGSGIEWHANLRMDQNLITRGDLPRFVMDSYEECRGPPRLFLLDKFDVAGAGACLKRYSDPSFYKTELASTEMKKAKREKKSRKIKKREARLKKGDALEIFSTSQFSSRLHQLASDEKNMPVNVPTSGIRLKRGHLNSASFNSRTGRSYMEDILELRPFEKRTAFDNSFHTTHLKAESSDVSVSGREIYEISVEDPINKFMRRKRTAVLSPKRRVPKLTADELGEDISKGGNLESFPEQISNFELDSSATFHREGKKYEEIGGGSKPEASMDGCRSDDLGAEKIPTTFHEEHYASDGSSTKSSVDRSRSKSDIFGTEKIPAAFPQMDQSNELLEGNLKQEVGPDNYTSVELEAEKTTTTSHVVYQKDLLVDSESKTDANADGSSSDKLVVENIPATFYNVGEKKDALVDDGTKKDAALDGYNHDNFKAETTILHRLGQKDEFVGSESEIDGNANGYMPVDFEVDKKPSIDSDDSGIQAVVDGYRSDEFEVEKTPSTINYLDQKGASVNDEIMGKVGADGYMSDDAASEMDNYMDALTTMESEMETDTESRAKRERGLFNVVSHEKDSEINKEQDLHGHCSDTHSIEGFSTTCGSNSLFKKERSSYSSDSLSNLADVQSPKGNGATSVDVPGIFQSSFTSKDAFAGPVPDNSCFGSSAKHSYSTDGDAETEVNLSSKMCLAEIHDLSSELLTDDGNILKTKSSDCIAPTEFGNEESDSYHKDLVSTFIHLTPSASSNEGQLARSEQTEISSLYVEDSAEEIGKHSGNDLQHALETSRLKLQMTEVPLTEFSESCPGESLNGEIHNSPLHTLPNSSDIADMPGGTKDNDVLEVLAPDVTTEGSSDYLQVIEVCDPPTQTVQDSTLELVPTGDVEDCASAADNVMNRILDSPDSITASVENQLCISTVQDPPYAFLDGQSPPECLPVSPPTDSIDTQANNLIVGVENGVDPSSYSENLKPADDLREMSEFTVHEHIEPNARILPLESECCCCGEPCNCHVGDLAEVLSPCSGSETLLSEKIEVLSYTLELEEREKSLPEGIHPNSSILMGNTSEVADFPSVSVVSNALQHKLTDEDHMGSDDLVSGSLPVTTGCNDGSHGPIGSPVDTSEAVNLPSISVASNAPNKLTNEDPTLSDDLVSGCFCVATSCNDKSPEPSGSLESPLNRIQLQEEYLSESASNLYESEISESPNHETQLESDAQEIHTVAHSENDEALPESTLPESSESLDYFRHLAPLKDVQTQVPVMNDPEGHVSLSLSDQESELKSGEDNQLSILKSDHHSYPHENATHTVSLEQAIELEAVDRNSVPSPHEEEENCESFDVLIQRAETDPPHIDLQQPSEHEKRIDSCAVYDANLTNGLKTSSSAITIPTLLDPEACIPVRPAQSLEISKSPLSSCSLSVPSTSSPFIPSFGLLAPEMANQRSSGAEECCSLQPDHTQKSSEFPITDSNSSLPSIPAPVVTSFGLFASDSMHQGALEPELSRSSGSPFPVSHDPPTNLEDMPPPLPPLPPLEWRMGKVRLASLTFGGEITHSPDSFLPLLTTKDEKSWHGSSLQGDASWPLNPFAPLPSMENEKPQYGSPSLREEMVQPSNFLVQLPPLGGERPSLALEGQISQPPRLSMPLSVVEDENDHHAMLTLEGVTQQPLCPFLQLQTVEEEMPKVNLDVGGNKPKDPLIERGEKPSLALEGRMPQPPPSSYMPVPVVEDEYPRDVMHTSEGVNQPLDPFPQLHTEDEKPKGNFHLGPNQPKDPLIEAIASHDRSMLRKTSECIQTVTKPKSDERNSLLEQIRTKSFNLKPAVAAKPIIHGPNTNLNVVAILEKANAIRQAFAGSDEDDDSDSWSDS